MALKTFLSGGVHPNDNKQYSKNAQTISLPLPAKVVILLSQHIGGSSTPIVDVGDRVLTGQMIAEPSSHVSIPMHASISGKITAIENFPHPAGTLVKGIEIESDGKDEWIELVDDTNYMDLVPAEMLDRVKEAGICGMGGAGFPTHIKLSPPADKPIDTVIVNGVECEPYLTNDCRMMVEYPQNIVSGLKIVMKILGAKRGIIAIEANKPKSVKMFRKLVKADGNIKVEKLKSKYPQGAEKQLIFATTRRKVPNKGGLPSSVGCIVDNVATILNIYEAVRYKKPLIERIITVTGKIVNKPSNIATRIGTKFSELIEFCNGTKKPIAKIISGGPMMGFAVHDLDRYSTKTSSGIILFDETECKKLPEHTCLRCGRCVDACPMDLMPFFIAVAVKYDDIPAADKAGATDCMKCGCCAYVCPAHIKLIQWINLAKLKLAEKKSG
jgi:electron transport complex protein RnfC